MWPAMANPQVLEMPMSSDRVNGTYGSYMYFS